MPSPFYDNYIERQIKSGINNRIYGLYKRMLKIGLRKNHYILEIGCGIGALTFLLSKRITSGAIEAIDYSEKSIDYAAKHIVKSNVVFTCSDVLEYEPRSGRFDFILLFDVLEHIPAENYYDVFTRISRWMNENSRLLINLPNPDYIAFEQKQQSSNLQEIDQPVHFYQLANILKENQLQICKMDTYSVWVENDYQFYIVQKQTEFHEKFMEENLVQKIKTRLVLKLRSFTHRYPV